MLTFLTISGINDRMNHETKIKSPERTNHRKPNYGLRRMVAIALVGTGFATGMYAVNNHNDRSDRPVKPEAVAMGHVDHLISSLTIEDGARIRKDPFIPDIQSEPNNLVSELDLKDSIKVETDGKAVVATETADGSWFGLPAQELRESLQRVDPDLELELKGDSDGYVWINQQKATPERTDVADDSNQ